MVRAHARMWFVLAAAGAAVLFLWLTGVGNSAGSEPPSTHKGFTAAKWHQRYVREHRLLTRLGVKHRALQHEAWQTERRRVRAYKRDAGYAIELAASAFGVSSSEMWAVARCETGGTFSPHAKNSSSSASGLFQFLDSTWASQGIRGFSVFDPVANALGAARIVARQGWRQWSCQP